MSVVSIFVRRGEDDDAGLRYAAGLAKRLDRKLEAVCALTDPARAAAYAGPEFMIGVTAYTIEAAKNAENDIAEASEAAFRSIVAEAGLDADRAVFRKSVGLPERIAGDAAVLADAIVFPREAALSGKGLSPSLHFTMMDRRLPVVVAGSAGTAGGPLIIGWDGSDQAARAVMFHDALIRTAPSVIVAQSESGLDASEDGDAHTTDRILSWLADRDVAAETKALEGPPGKALLTLAHGVDAEMIVCGAYGHSRTGEMLFGGVTRTLLHAEDAPALALAH